MIILIIRKRTISTNAKIKFEVAPRAAFNHNSLSGTHTPHTSSEVFCTFSVSPVNHL